MPQLPELNYTPPSYVDRNTGQVMVWDASSHTMVPAEESEVDGAVSRTRQTGNDANLFDPATTSEQYHNGENDFGKYANRTCPHCSRPVGDEHECMSCGFPLDKLDVPRLHTQNNPFNDDVPKADLNTWEPALPSTALAALKTPKNPPGTSEMSDIHAETINRMAIGTMNVAAMDDCPNCGAPGMVERNGEKICPDCGHRQKIIEASVKQGFDFGNVVNDLEGGAGDVANYAENHPWQTAALAAGLAIPGIGLAADAGFLGAGAAGAADAAEAADAAGEAETAGGLSSGGGGGLSPMRPGAGTPDVTPAQAPGRVRALMNGAMGAGKSGLSKAWSGAKGMAMFQGLNDMSNGLMGGNGQSQVPDYSQYQTQLAKTADTEPDDPDSMGSYSNRDDGDDVTDEKTQGAMEDHGDTAASEFLRDLADWGGANAWNGDQRKALKQFNDALPTIIEFNLSDEPGATAQGHKGDLLRHVDKLLKSVFPDLSDIGAVPEMHHETEKKANMPVPTGMTPPALNTQEGGEVCPLCGQSHPGQPCPMMAGAAGAGAAGAQQMAVRPQQMMLNTPISRLEKMRTAGRRPKMCPYHSDLVDYSLTLGDPAAALQNTPGAYGAGHCKGGHEGTCNFKPEMVTQQYWDDREERLRQQREERERALQPQPEVAEAPMDMEPETDMPFEVTDDSEGHHPDTSGGDSAVGAPSSMADSGMAMAASRIAAALAAYGQNAELAPAIARAVFAEEDFGYGLGTPETAQDQFGLGGTERSAADQFDTPIDMHDNDAQCPMCGGPGVPLGQLGRLSHFRCRNCGHDFSSSPEHEQSPLGPGPSQDTTIAKTAAGITDTTQLQPGQTYVMRSNEYSVPDLVTVKSVKPNSIIVDIHGEGMTFPDEISLEELQNQGISFEPQGAEQMFEAEQGSNPTSAPDAGQTDDLSDLPTPVSHEEADDDFESHGMDYDGSDAEENMLWDAVGQAAEPALAHTAGKNFSQAEQREFIQEEGTARNLDKLSLEGTHYEEPPEFVMWLD